MESIDPVWFFGAIALATGLLLGLLISRLLNPSTDDVEQLKAELESERTEMERYKASVNSHFNKTSDLVNELTQDYVKVYRHLAEGAQTLSDTREFSHLLEQQKGRVLISVEDGPKPTPAAGADDSAGETPRPQASGDDIVEDLPPVTAAEEIAPTGIDDESKQSAAEEVKDAADSAAADDDRKKTVSGADAAPVETGAETVSASADASAEKSGDDEQARQPESRQPQSAATAEADSSTRA